MTESFNAPIIFRSFNPEAMATTEGKAQAEAFAASIEELEESDEQIKITVSPEGVELLTTTVERADELLKKSSRNREGGAEWYLDLNPAEANLPPSVRLT